MTYKETLDYLFNALPMFQRVGASAFKKDLSNTIKLCSHLGNPQDKFQSVHVAGTNGKGSTSHAICAVLMKAGYKVGLYTSPHLKSFTERIKVNGQEIPEAEVVHFVAQNQEFIEELHPSFFEMTVGMAFWYFAKTRVDIAVVEVGMGGRLDSTNIIQPKVSVITNISMDHMQYLGNTLKEIAGEKAGIIKQNTPVVISQKQEEIEDVFLEIAHSKNAAIFFADQEFEVNSSTISDNSLRSYTIRKGAFSYSLYLDLLGVYQIKNLPGILKSIDVLRSLGYNINDTHIKSGLMQIVNLTGLKGRWQVLSRSPLMVCDTGHNEDGMKMLVEQIRNTPHDKLFFILGMVNDKDLSKVLALLPQHAYYFFCQANIPRALGVDLLSEMAVAAGLEGEVEKDVNKAIEKAMKKAGPKDMIFIGGSTFVVAEIKEL
ncbi:MAG: bifunctional folylpolyglutamate synthase/dihydrofolate synthase [Mongoliibacter sp.]|uniref:bifunctional folylpolyglutamate synthase/dihydrofolate synthase n=1 Tax=Mongoliibacter sp. TaxID=2022438 RepID=UPI0012F01220|nr:folylpolyglutamate synthase/dihydrofolate synthase family protein [Mongoliibacter sp.]TVP47600.1 MAG: bifunctional folylpolyglutamate synthase/dihydrofolate synthase [Mongoliibacter sp.]